jgi:hypothetical protein
MDIPQHLTATKRILTLRILNDPQLLKRHFHVLAIESVLYQTFLLSTGLWSDPVATDYDFDDRFWLQAERLLVRPTPGPNGYGIMNSPVLGIPVSLYRLVISLKKYYNEPTRPDQATLSELSKDVAQWEAELFGIEAQMPDGDEESKQRHRMYQSIIQLHVLVVSLLFEQISHDKATPKCPPRASSDRWQVAMAIRILQLHLEDEEWTLCFICHWPVYTLGLFMSTVEGRELVRFSIQRRWDRTKCSQLKRYQNNLEVFWAKHPLTESSMDSEDTKWQIREPAQRQTPSLKAISFLGDHVH